MSRPPLPLATRLGLVIGAVMVVLGSYVALHPLWSREPVTSSRLLDAGFALFFLLKGWWYLRRGWRPAPPSPPGDGT